MHVLKSRVVGAVEVVEPLLQTPEHAVQHINFWHEYEQGVCPTVAIYGGR
jgi:hypothetical protein